MLSNNTENPKAKNRRKTLIILNEQDLDWVLCNKSFPSSNGKILGNIAKGEILRSGFC